VFYINLDYRTDRRTHIEAQLAPTYVSSRVERFAGIVPTYDAAQEQRVQGFIERGLYESVKHSKGILGCTRSHLEVFKLSYERGYTHVLILEDDFEFLVSPQVFEERVRALFDSNITFDVCMLSYYLLQGDPIPETPWLTRVSEAQTASGYIVAREYLPTLIALYEEAVVRLMETGEHWNYANDQVWKRLQPQDRWICFTERLGKQNRWVQRQHSSL